MVLTARVDAGCSQRVGSPGQLTARRDQTPGGYRRVQGGRWLLPTSWLAWPAYSAARPDTWRVQGTGVDAPPTASACQSGGCHSPLQEASMTQVSTVGLDLAK